ncbi:MAG: chromosome segregation protein SMC [Thermoplasmataceae archaeon]
MFLESLELHNFKSFGVRKRIVFRKGFTVISGPNGSGKSNIGDSLLFVLGTRSSKAVRAERLGDLIHKSSDEKRNRDYCSVTVTLDTEDPEKTPEDRKVVLKRELVAEMEGYKSNYYINGQRVRHSDVADLLDSLHIYLDSYSFVLQGDINNIVKMTGFERRKLLESISGIESFDVQIEKAQGDILSINENLGRLEVLLDQTRKRRQDLEAEKDVAERYEKLSSAIRNLRMTILNIEKEGMQREVASHSRNIDQLMQEIVGIESRITGMNQQLKSLEDENGDLKQKLEVSGNSQLREIREQIENQRVTIAETGIRVENGQERIRNLSDQVEEDSRELEKTSRSLEWLQANMDENSRTLEEIRSKMSRISQELKSIRDKNSRSSTEILKKQEDIKEKDSTIRELNGQIDHLMEERDRIQAERSGVVGELGTLEEKKKDLEFQVRDAAWRLKEIEKDAGSSKENTEKLSFRYYDLKRRLEELRKRKDVLQSELNAAGREHTQLQSQISSRSGSANRAVATILGARNQNKIQGIHGTIRELVTFPEEFRPAIEAAAGARLNSVVVEDDGVAEQCLDLLKRERAGKMTFLPLNKVLGGRPRGKAITVRSSDGAMGYVFEKITFDQKYEGIIWYAVQDTVIVRDVPTARKYMVGVRLVTMDGDIFEASGAITGGYQDRGKSQENLDARISELSAKIREISAELDAINAEIPQVESEFDEVSQKLRETSRNEGSRSAEIQQWKKLVDEGKPKLEELSSRISDLNRKLSEVDGKLSGNDRESKEIRVKISRLESDKSAIFDEIREISPQFAEKENALETELTSLRSRESDFSAELVKIGNDISHMRQKSQEIRERIRSNSEEKIKLEADLAVSTGTLAQQRSDLEKLRAVEAEISEKSREIVDALNVNESEIVRIKEGIETEKAGIGTKNDLILSSRLKIENLQSRINDLEQQMGEVGGEILPDKRYIQEAKRELDARNSELVELGPVNQKAVAEYQQVSADLDALSREMDSLSREKADLEILMGRLNHQKEKIFMEMYGAINDNMKSIYGEISGGGEASLEMSNESDPLNSEIFIRAKPKGKSFSKIEALSGGEKSLTALSFILAVQRINPSPLYYLDEVDMFLDGSNAEHVGKMFKLNSNTSQVFSVSLRKAMLKYADHVVVVTSFDGENTDVFEKSIPESGNMEVQS